MSEDGIIWGQYDNKEFMSTALGKGGLAQLESIVGASDWKRVLGVFGNHHGGTISHWTPLVIKYLSNVSVREVPEALLIPAKRQLTKKGEAFEGQSGQGLIDHLAELQSPGFD